ncbi:hypothetical protein [Bacillus sp. SM2101]|uniref:hypothetical protein n=1 Tax=Bacillus sp. SM2101 TaxID=2805366 RepID=UPI001BDEFD50|nr:hypothetical protein [Bacillus sp. SM2101]
MRYFIAKIFVKLLNYLNVSVVIGCEIGEIKMKYEESFFRNTSTNQDSKIVLIDGKEFEIPDGKLKIKSQILANGERHEYYRKVAKKKKSVESQ